MSRCRDRWLGAVLCKLVRLRMPLCPSLLTLKGFVRWPRRSQEGDVFQERRGPQIVPRIWESYWSEDGVDTRFILMWGLFKAWLHAGPRAWLLELKKVFFFFSFEKVFQSYKNDFKNSRPGTRDTCLCHSEGKWSTQMWAWPGALLYLEQDIELGRREDSTSVNQPFSHTVRAQRSGLCATQQVE